MEDFPIGFIVALLIVLISAFLFFRDSGSSTGLAAPTKQKVDGVVLIGCSGSGKTVITHQLVSRKVPDTISSMAPSFNEVALPSSKKKMQLVDFPGHERLRESMFEHIKGARGIVLVVDPRTTKTIKQTALLIYELFKSPNFSSSTPLLIFCNKSDMPDAKSHDRVKVLLQREVDNMRKTGTTMSVAGTSSPSSASLRINDDLSTPFSFDFGDSTAPVTFASGSALSVEGLSSLVQFIEKC